MTIYLTSDPHFGHQLVSELRGFPNVHEHDGRVLESYTRGIGTGDDLWILGDLSGGGRRAEERALEILLALRSTTGVRLHLVEGNHDSCASIHRDGWKRQRRFLEVFESVHAFVRRRGPERVPVLMSHYPYEGDGPERGPERYGYARLKDTGAWLLHGHTHTPDREDLRPPADPRRLGRLAAPGRVGRDREDHRPARGGARGVRMRPHGSRSARRAHRGPTRGAAMRCDACGRFTRHLNDVLDFQVGGIEREVCDDCYGGTRRDEEKQDG